MGEKRTQKNVPKENLISTQDTFQLKYSVVNPTKNTFIGNLNYKYEKECLNIVGLSFNETIEINPEDKKGVIKGFNYNANRYNRNIECVQVPLKINVILYDKSGLLKDSYETIIRITE